MRKLVTLSWRFWDGWIAIFCFAVALCVCDAVYLLWVSGGGASEVVAHAFAAEIWSLTIALLPVSIVIGALLVAAGRSPREPGERPVRDWLLRGKKDAQLQKAAGVFTGALLFTLTLLAGAWAAFELSRRIVRDHFQAAAIALGFAAIAVLAATVYPLCHRAVVRGFAVLARVPGVGWVVRCPFRMSAFVLVLVGGAGIALIVRYWRDVFQYVPWSIVLRLVFAVALAALLYRSWRTVRDIPRLRNTMSAVLVLVLFALAFPAFRLQPSDWEVRRAAFHDAIGGKAALRVLRAAFDKDGDGFMALLGDGDCDETKPKAHYGAFEIPDNGIDEDCDGRDLTIPLISLCEAPSNERPSQVPGALDVVLITVDALAANRLGIAEYPRSITANLDAFAKQSVYFDSAFSQGPSTRLSFPSMFTSKWDSMIARTPRRRLPYSLKKEETQLQEKMLANGYETVAVIPDRNFVPSYWDSATRGFSVVDDSAVSSSHNADRITARALHALEQKRQGPLYLWVHYYDPHSPYRQPTGVTRFGSSDVDIYDAEVLYTDRELGPLLDVLTTRPNTLTIITADHGTVFHPQPKTRKARYGYDVYTATLHVPLLFHASFVAPRVWSGPASTMDIYPTIANLVPLKNTPSLCGRSLVPILLGQAVEAPRVTFHQFYLPERKVRDKKDPLVTVAARDGRYNLILSRGTGSYELYDWRADYFEMNDLARSPEHRDALTRLQQSLVAFVYTARGQ